MLLWHTDRQTDRQTHTHPLFAAPCFCVAPSTPWPACPRSPEAHSPEAHRQPPCPRASPLALPSCEPRCAPQVAWRRRPRGRAAAAPLTLLAPLEAGPSRVGDPGTERLRSLLCCVFPTYTGVGEEWGGEEPAFPLPHQKLEREQYSNKCGLYLMFKIASSLTTHL